MPSDIEASALVRVVSLSDFAAGVLVREQGWSNGWHARLDDPYDPAALARFAVEIAMCDEDPAAVKQRLRRERNRQLLSIFWRETNGTAVVEDTLAALTDVADRMLAAAAGYTERRLAERYGELRDEAGNRVPLLVIGMGKLGGGELNFSSDIDVIFTYPADGESDGDKVLEAQPYFGRLVRGIVDLLDDVTEDGFVFRTDTRLRPFGDSGPPVTSFAALETYLLAARADLGALCLCQGARGRAAGPARRAEGTARGTDTAVRIPRLSRFRHFRGAARPARTNCR